MNTKQMMAKRIKAEMELQGVSEEELCRKTGLDYDIIDKIMREKNGRVSIYAYVAISKVLEISMDFILGMSENKEAKKQR